MDKTHLKRWITSLAALPVLGYAIYKGGLVFAALISAAGILALWEYFRIVHKTYQEGSYFVLALAYATSFSMTAAAHFFDAPILVILIALNLILCALIFLSFFKTRPQIVQLLRIQTQGIVYIPLALSLLVLIRKTPEGMLWIFFLLVIIFAGDISAYYFGTYLGRRKLSPSVSPGKTVEGAAGGILANILVGSVFKSFLFSDLPWGPCILFFIGIGAAGQIGDLFESGLKRMAGIKDSGFLLPGHGGIVDRIDALLFAAPVMYFFIIYAARGA